MKKYLNASYILEIILVLISLLSLVGAIIYYFYSLNNIGLAITLILVILAFIIILRFRKYNKENDNKQNLQLTHSNNNSIYFLLLTSLPSIALATVGYLLLIAYCFYTLLTHQTAQAIISPWQVLPSYFFIFYGLATGLLILIILLKRQLSLVLISLHYFLSFSIAVFVYQLGYGFDSFIHQATVDLINKTGLVEPKPFYYLGQYSLEVILHKITALPIVWLDRLLVPMLAALYLPIYIWQFLKKWFENNTTSLLLLLVILILPFSFLIVTTPQNLAYLFLLLVLLMGLNCQNIYKLNILYLLALAAVFIQPIAGIPALLFVILLSVYHSNRKKVKKYLYALIFISTTMALPLAFYFVDRNVDTINELSSVGTIHELPLPKLIIPDQENFILNFIYLYGFNFKIVFSLLAIIGLFMAYHYGRRSKILALYFYMSMALLISYLLTKLLPFNFLIYYERNNYADRVLLLAAFFLLPFIIALLYKLIENIRGQNKIVQLSIFSFIIILITASLYLSYPRFDHYHNSHGYSVSQNDINAVHWIGENASQNYIVLANQQVSAAALHEFGFAKYFNMPPSKSEISNPKSQIFYYPIPTGGPLYQYYLDMVYEKPSHETMLAAMKLAGVNEGYFVLNKYWWASPKILAEAKLEANGWQEFDKGEVYVFRYSK